MEIALVDEIWYQKYLQDVKLHTALKIVEAKHYFGKRTLEIKEKGEAVYGDHFIDQIVEDLQVSRSDIYKSIQFYKKFPELCNQVTQLSWKYITQKLLPTPKKRKFMPPPLPDKKYNVVYGDPPWDIGSIILDEKWTSPIEDKYETLSLDEIKSIEVENICAADCSLFLWTTQSFLKQVFNVIRSWGFKYHCCITWDKGSGWTQNGFHWRTEFCLYAYKGLINIEQKGKAIPTIIIEPSREHSRKPDLMYEMIENNIPEPRIELFARQKRPGWDVWGSEV